MCPREDKGRGQQQDEPDVGVAGEKAKPENDCEEIPIEPARLVPLSNQPQPFRDEQNDDDDAETLRSRAVGERVEDRVARPDDGQREANPKDLADRQDEIKRDGAEREVLRADQQPHPGISQLRESTLSSSSGDSPPALELFAEKKRHLREVTVGGRV